MVYEGRSFQGLLIFFLITIAVMTDVDFFFFVISIQALGDISIQKT